jgi:hypothetical protein
MSQKLKVVLLDAAISLITYFSVKYLNPSIVEDIKFVIGVIQVVIATWMAGEYVKEMFVISLMKKFNVQEFAVLFKEVMDEKK